MRDISAIVVSYNRRAALLRTLSHLRGHPLIGEIIVVDNASHDGSSDAARGALEGFQRASVVDAGRNSGVEAFNTGASLATLPLLLVLDDDAYPAPAALGAARDALVKDRALGAIALAPHHPEHLGAEWPHARADAASFPMMGCGNLVRAEAWRRAGGYLGAYFLYRNDTDLALTLLALGYGVRFDPAWVVWHDSPCAAAKSDRWLRLATRNWVWMARRHGRGAWKWLGIALGAARAFMHAGVDNSRAELVMDGLRAGLREDAPRASAEPDGSHWRALIGLQMRRGR